MFVRVAALLATSCFALSAFALTQPYASGTAGELKWEVRFNHLSNTAGAGSVCDHTAQGKPRGAWCEPSDANNARAQVGIEDRLIQIMNEPDIKSVTLSYFSFSSTTIQNALCQAAQTKNLKVTIYIDQSSAGSLAGLAACHTNIKVVGQGVGPFGAPGSHLQHMKIFMASSLAEPTPLSDLTSLAPAQRQAAENGRTFLVSSSANMSSYGTSLHFDNWLIFEGKFKENVMQSNACVFSALKLGQANVDSRKQFARKYKACRNKIALPELADLKFYAVPHDGINPEPLKAFERVVKSAQNEVLVAIHRLTTNALVTPLVLAKYNGVSVSVLFDDDTLRTGKVNGGPVHDVGKDDIKSDRRLRAENIRTLYMETNASTTKHLHHNKFVVADGKALFQGAGNFTGTSLNTYALGNYEQFYEIRVPGIVKAYRDAWLELKSMATPFANHPVANNPDLPLND